MVKVIGGISFICLLGILSYIFYINQDLNKEQRESSTFNAVGEKRRGDFPAIKLQRQNIEGAIVFRFESKNNNEIYELDEEQLDVFAQSLNSVNSANEFGKIESYQSIEDKDLYRKEIENRERKYFQYDNEL